MQQIETISDLRNHLAPMRRVGQRIGFVPTMGAIHEGHRTLIRQARRECDRVVVSIFVNPTQFGPDEDFERYPRPLEADLAACQEEGTDVAFCPSVSEMYPAETVTTISVAKLTEGMCARHRPGHFDGVATVVAKLFHIVQPDMAYFGQKDAQQVAVIKRMVCDLNIPVQVIACPTVREPDGLAMSSRNRYLSPEQRTQARSLYATLQWARDQILSGHEQVAPLLKEMQQRIESAGPCQIDYIVCVDPQTLEELSTARSSCLLALAVKIGPARLIDNLLVDVADRLG